MNNSWRCDFDQTRMGPGEARPPARGVLAGSGTRCARVWYKVFQGLARGVPGSGTRCSRVWYKVLQGLVLGGTSGDHGDHGESIRGLSKFCVTDRQKVLKLDIRCRCLKTAILEWIDKIAVFDLLKSAKLISRKNLTIKNSEISTLSNSHCGFYEIFVSRLLFEKFPWKQFP